MDANQQQDADGYYAEEELNSEELDLSFLDDDETKNTEPKDAPKTS